MESFFFNETSESHYVTARDEPERVGIVVLSGDLRAVHSVEYQMGVESSIFIGKDVAYNVADDYDCIAESRSAAFSEPQDRLGHPSPFLPVVVRTVVGSDHFYAEHSCHGDHYRRPDSVDVQNVGIHTPRCQHGQKCMDDSFYTFASRCVDIKQFDSTVGVAAVVIRDVWRAAYDCHVVAHCGQSRIQFLAVGFYSPLNIRDSAGAGHYYT